MSRSTTKAPESVCCHKKTPVRMEICYPGLDCEGQKILNMYGAQARIRALVSDCEWTDIPAIQYPNKCFDFSVDPDGEYEFQWRPLRHGVKWGGGQEAYSTIPGPWSESTVFSVACAAPVQGEPAIVSFSPGCVR